MNLSSRPPLSTTPYCERRSSFGFPGQDLKMACVVLECGPCPIGAAARPQSQAAQRIVLEVYLDKARSRLSPGSTLRHRIPTPPRHSRHSDTSVNRQLGPTLRHQCQASVKPSRHCPRVYSVNGVKWCQDQVTRPTLRHSTLSDTPDTRHPRDPDTRPPPSPDAINGLHHICSLPHIHQFT